MSTVRALCICALLSACASSPPPAPPPTSTVAITTPPEPPPPPVEPELEATLHEEDLDEGPCEPATVLGEYVNCLEDQEYASCEETAHTREEPGFALVDCERTDADESSVIDTLVIGRATSFYSSVATAMANELYTYTAEYETRVLASETKRVGAVRVVRFTVGYAWRGEVPDESDGDSLHEVAYQERVTVCIDDVDIRCPVAGELTRELAEALDSPDALDFAQLSRRARAVASVRLSGHAIEVWHGHAVHRTEIVPRAAQPLDVRALLDAVSRDEARAFALAHQGTERPAPYDDVVALVQIGQATAVLRVPREGRVSFEARSSGSARDGSFRSTLTRALRKGLGAPQVLVMRHNTIVSRYELFARSSSGAVIMMPWNAYFFRARPTDSEIDDFISPTAL